MIKPNSARGRCFGSANMSLNSVMRSSISIGKLRISALVEFSGHVGTSKGWANLFKYKNHNWALCWIVSVKVLLFIILMLEGLACLKTNCFPSIVNSICSFLNLIWLDLSWTTIEILQLNNNAAKVIPSHQKKICIVVVAKENLYRYFENLIKSHEQQ